MGSMLVSAASDTLKDNAAALLCSIVVIADDAHSEDAILIRSRWLGNVMAVGAVPALLARLHEKEG